MVRYGYVCGKCGLDSTIVRDFNKKDNPADCPHCLHVGTLKRSYSVNVSYTNKDFHGRNI